LGLFYYLILSAFSAEAHNPSAASGATLIKKKITFSSYIDIQSGAVAKSYMRKGVLRYEEMCKYEVIFEEAISHI
jgi:hypothetical protein